MNKNLKRESKNLFKNLKTKPSRSLGQNFLINEDVLKKVVRAADLRPTDTVLEIGPGSGILTKELAKKAKRVIAVEKDQKMADFLKGSLKSYENTEIISGDILKIKDWSASRRIKIKDYKIVANLPYYITSPVIRKFLEAKNPPQAMVFMVQKEVAQRICSKPPEMSLLAVSVQFYSKPEIISYVPKESFWPRPKVDSAIIKIIPFNDNRKKIPADLFFKIVKAGFSQPRKQIINNFAKNLIPLPPYKNKSDKEKIRTWLSKSDILPSQRAESLTLENWLELAESYELLT